MCSPVVVRELDLDGRQRFVAAQFDAEFVRVEPADPPAWEGGGGRVVPFGRPTLGQLQMLAQSAGLLSNVRPVGGRDREPAQAGAGPETGSGPGARPPLGGPGPRR